MDQDERLAALAGQIRALYCEERNRWHRAHENRVTTFGTFPVARYDGGDTGTGIRYKPVWPRFAKFVLKHCVDARKYLQAHFRVRSGHPPEPEELMGDRALAAYRATSTDGVDQLRRVFNFQKERFEAELDKLLVCKVRHGWSDEQVHRAVLTNALVEMSALFRYSVALRCGYADLAEEFREAALVQYMGRRTEYDEVWGPQWLPAALVTQARETVQAAERVVGVAAPTSPPPVDRSRPRGNQRPLVPSVPPVPPEPPPPPRRVRPVE